MRTLDTFELHRAARVQRARLMRVLARRVQRLVRHWVVEVLFRPFFDPLSA